MIIGRKEEIKLLKDSGFEFKRKPENWLEAFEGLKDVIRKSDTEKKVIFIDELSWMDTPKGSDYAVLYDFWRSSLLLEFPKKRLKYSSKC